MPLYAFRIMVACGVIMLLIIGLSFWNVIRGRIGQKNGCTARHCTVCRCLGSRSSPVGSCGIRPSTVAIGEVLPTAVANLR